MSDSKKEGILQYAVPSGGYIFGEDVNQYVLCKPRLMPLRSVTMEKMEKMQQEAENKMRADLMLKESSN